MTTEQLIQQEAEKIVEMYVQIISNEIGYIGAIMRIKETAIQCAIKHVEGIYEEIAVGFDTMYASERLEHYSEILNQLKQM